jgi:hypothetical protein
MRTVFSHFVIKYGTPASLMCVLLLMRLAFMLSLSPLAELVNMDSPYSSATLQLGLTCEHIRIYTPGLLIILQPDLLPGVFCLGARIFRLMLFLLYIHK